MMQREKDYKMSRPNVQKWRLIFRDKMNVQTNQEAGVIPAPFVKLILFVFWYIICDNGTRSSL